MTRWERVGYTTRWGRYLAEVETNLIRRAQRLAGNVGQGIDLGCGGGRWSKLLADQGWQMTCTDVNADDLAVCGRKVPSATCVLAHSDQRSVPALSGSIRLALCIEVMPLLDADWFPAEMNRVLAGNGVLVGVHINGNSLRGMASRLNSRRSRLTHYRYYQSPYSRCRRLLQQNGFEMIHEESCCWGPFTRESNSPFVPAFVKMERALGLNRVVTWGPWVAFIARKTPRSFHSRAH